MDVVSYVLSKKYTEDTVIGLGAIKGANCTIQSAVHENGKTTITFAWKALDDTTRTTEIEVLDGTPIYVWQSGESYNVNDLALYNNNFYQCIIANSDAVFTPSKWQSIGGGDTGNYSIVEQSTDLPSTFGSTDRKMYYVIADGAFYLWNGTNWVEQEPAIITNADIDALFD